MGILSKIINTLVRDRNAVVSEFSFCETETASPFSCWHIRKLTDAGKKLSGGADTPALCGKNVAWDLHAPINDNLLSYACEKCSAAYMEKKNEER